MDASPGSFLFIPVSLCLATVSLLHASGCAGLREAEITVVNQSGYALQHLMVADGKGSYYVPSLPMDSEKKFEVRPEDAGETQVTFSCDGKRLVVRCAEPGSRLVDQTVIVLSGGKQVVIEPAGGPPRTEVPRKVEASSP